MTFVLPSIGGGIVASPTAPPTPQPLVNNFSGNFDGTNDAVNCGALSAYQGATSMSLSVWFKSDVAGVGPDVGMSQDFNHQFGFTSYSTTANYVLVNETNNDNLYGQYTPPNDTNWHHYLMTFSSGTLLLYIDGSLVTFTSVVDQGPSTLPNVTSDFLLGMVTELITQMVLLTKSHFGQSH